ncbi:MAG: hypothetical protein ACFE8A_07580 [Candidatus Hodarchaeota archaeon]
MKRKNAICTILIFFLLLSLFLNVGIFSINNQINKNNKFFKEKEYMEIDLQPKTSQSLNYSSIYKNASIIYRGFHSINFTINASDFQYVNYTRIRISFRNNTVGIYDMTYVPGTNKNFTFTYTPAYNAPLGLHEARFIVYNKTGVELNTQTTVSNFTVKSNCMVGLDPEKSEYRRGETLSTSLIVYDFDPYNFKWNVTIVDSVNESNQKNVFNVGNDLLHIELEINETFEQTNKKYYIKVNMTDINTYQRIAAAYFQFKVLLPESILKQSSITFNPTSIFRTQSCTLNLNVSAQENGLSIGLINVTFILKDTNSIIVNNINLMRKADDTFSTSFSVVATSPKGTYTYVIKTFYKNEEIEQYSGTLSVKNNLPDIDGYEINNYDTDESISVLYGEDLVFEFDAFDVEGVQYITLLLINEDDDEYEITREYEEDLEITVRTAELIIGTWDIYVYVTDTDGATVGLDDDFDTAPQKITIIPDTLGEMLSWIMLVLGLISGVLFGTAISYYMMKSKKLKPEKEIEVIEKKPKKEKISRLTPVKREAAKKLIEEEKPEKKEPKPPRKIKRKLK